MTLIRALAALTLIATPAVASAQALQCTVSEQVETPRPDGPSVREPKRDIPIGSYTLAITWAPQYCRDNASRDSARFQCGSGNRFGFTLHGLWPDGRGKTWPQYCRPAAILPPALIRQNLCTTPSPQLLQHEYAKHGTCMNIPPAGYFARSTALYRTLRYPDMDALSRRRSLTAGQFAAAFARANRGITARMMRVTANRQGWLEEVWLCLDTRFAYVTCPEHQGGLKPGARLKIWRGGR